MLHLVASVRDMSAIASVDIIAVVVILRTPKDGCQPTGDGGICSRAIAKSVACTALVPYCHCCWAGWQAWTCGLSQNRFTIVLLIVCSCTSPLLYLSKVDLGTSDVHCSLVFGNCETTCWLHKQSKLQHYICWASHQHCLRGVVDGSTAAVRISSTQGFH